MRNSLLKQAFGGEPGAVGERPELRPDHVLGDPAHPGRGVEAAVGAGEHAARVAHRRGHPLDPFGHHLGVLDEVGERVDHAGDQNLILVQNVAEMMTTGKPAYPVERTLLTTGMLAALMDSKAGGHQRVETPHLGVKYQP